MVGFGSLFSFHVPEDDGLSSRDGPRRLLQEGRTYQEECRKRSGD